MGQVTHPLAQIVPITLYVVSGQLHHVLRNYKDGLDARLRAEFSLQVAALIYRFVADHRRCLENLMGIWDGVVVVPSTKRPPTAQHPLVGALKMGSGGLRDQLIAPLTRGSVAITHRQASDSGYAAIEAVSGRRLLLVDDTFTSGANLQSAASALSLAGATVVGGLVVGRVIDPNFSPEAQALWAQASGNPFDFARCCIHIP